MSYGTTMVLTVSKATSTVWCKLEDGPKFLSLHFMHSWREDFGRFAFGSSMTSYTYDFLKHIKRRQ